MFLHHFELMFVRVVINSFCPRSSWPSGPRSNLQCLVIALPLIVSQAVVGDEPPGYFVNRVQRPLVYIFLTLNVFVYATWGHV